MINRPVCAPLSMSIDRRASTSTQNQHHLDKRMKISTASNYIHRHTNKMANRNQKQTHQHTHTHLAKHKDDNLQTKYHL